MSESTQKFPYGLDFQQETLRLMMTDLGFCAKSTELLHEGYFVTELRWFFRKMKEYYNTFNHLPTSSYLASETLKQTDYAQYEKIRASIESKTPDADYIKREITGFVRANIFISGYKEAATLYNAGRMDGAYETTFNKMQELIKVDFQKDRHSAFGDAWTVLNKAREQKENVIPTGIAPIDFNMQGGMMPQTWTTFLGSSNVGKSLLCASLAFHAVIAGKKVYVTVHEDEEEPTKMRYLSRFSGVPFSRLYFPKELLEKEEVEAIEHADQLLKHSVRLRFMYGAENTIENVKKEVTSMHRDWPFELYICDYGQCLTSTAFKSMDNGYKIQGYVYGELKQLCLELGIAGAGGAQVNREGMKINKGGGDLLRMTDVGDSIEICRKSSNVITINRSETNVKANRIIFLLDKVRNGKCPVAVECASNYAACATHLDSDTQREIPVNQEREKDAT